MSDERVAELERRVKQLEGALRAILFWESCPVTSLDRARARELDVERVRAVLGDRA